MWVIFWTIVAPREMRLGRHDGRSITAAGSKITGLHTARIFYHVIDRRFPLWVPVAIDATPPRCLRVLGDVVSIAVGQDETRAGASERRSSRRVGGSTTEQGLLRRGLFAHLEDDGTVRQLWNLWAFLRLALCGLALVVSILAFVAGVIHGRGTLWLAMSPKHVAAWPRLAAVGGLQMYWAAELADRTVVVKIG
jgi:hypothetical protein